MARQDVAAFFFSTKVRGKHTFWCCVAGLCSGVVLCLDAVLGSFFCCALILSWFLVLDVLVLVPWGGTLPEYCPDNKITKQAARLRTALYPSPRASHRSSTKGTDFVSKVLTLY
jgi:hypothetical protein